MENGRQKARRVLLAVAPPGDGGRVAPHASIGSSASVRTEAVAFARSFRGRLGDRLPGARLPPTLAHDVDALDIWMDAEHCRAASRGTILFIYFGRGAEAC